MIARVVYASLGRFSKLARLAAHFMLCLIRPLHFPILLALAACAAPVPNPVETQDGGPRIAVYLVAHDKHSGIAIRRADIPSGLWPEIRDFPRADYLEVGWGDRDYYYGRNQGFLDALRAAFGSKNPSVIHVAGVRGSLPASFPVSEIIEVKVSHDGFERLVRYIQNEYDRAGAAVAAPLGPGLYGDSRFYPGRETFSLQRTCNMWTARGLREAGLPIEDSITMEGVMSQARAIGKVIQEPHE